MRGGCYFQLCVILSEQRPLEMTLLKYEVRFKFRGLSESAWIILTLAHV